MAFLSYLFHKLKMFMMKNNFTHIPYVSSSQGEALQIFVWSWLKQRIMFPLIPYNIGIGRTQEYRIWNRNLELVVSTT